MQDCPDSVRVVVADQLARSTLLADNLRVKSKVHPEYKTTYHGGNWPEYEQALVRRGDVTLWLSAEAMDAWRPAPSGRPGGPRKFSDVSIMTALMLRLVFRLPLRQTEGFLRSVLALMRTDLEAPDHTTLSRRSQHLNLALDRIPAQRPVQLIVDSTGLSIVGEGEWAAVKHGTRGKRGRSGARDRTITRVKRLGRRRWKKASGYQRQARVETAIFRYKSIIGDGLRARTPGGRQTETLLACNVLNRMTELGRPASYSIGR